MNWFGHRCDCWRERICLRASGGLSEGESRELQEHLGGCADCRSYSAEIQSVTAPLATWEKNFSRVQPDEAARRRWTRAILTGTAKPARPAALRWTPQLAAVTVWRELIWPCRRAWIGMAAVWLVIGGVRVGLSGGSATGVIATLTPAPAMFQSWAEQQRLLAELIPPALHEPVAEPPRRHDSRPRSERRIRNLTA